MRTEISLRYRHVATCAVARRPEAIAITSYKLILNKLGEGKTRLGLTGPSVALALMIVTSGNELPF